MKAFIISNHVKPTLILRSVKKLQTKNYTVPGTYTVIMVSGNECEYAIDPTCEAEFVVE